MNKVYAFGPDDTFFQAKRSEFTKHKTQTVKVSHDSDEECAQ
jgi:hypothetical protein